jgi:hypothetical protein
MEAVTFNDTALFRVFISTTALAIAASAPAYAGFIPTSASSTVLSDARVDATNNPAATPDDPGLIPFFDQMDSEVSTVFSSASSYAGQSVFEFDENTIVGSGSALGDAIAFLPEGSTADSMSDFVFVFEVDAPTKLELDWSLRANGVGDDSQFFLGWLLQENGGDLGSTLITSDDNPGTWDQFSNTPESFQLTPGNTYSFSIGGSGNTAAGAASNTSDFYGSYSTQWQFSLNVPAPGTLALLTPVTIFSLRRRR